MPATVYVKEWNGAGRDETTVSVGAPARFCSADENAPGNDYPIVIPAAGFNYSYWKHFGLDLSGSFVKINNVRIYCDGDIDWDLGTGGMVMVGLKDDGETTDEGHGCPTASYQQSAGTPGETGIYLKAGTGGHVFYKSETVAPADFQDYDSAVAALLVDSTDHEAAEDTKAVVLQVKVDTVANGAVQGLKDDETFTFLYDET